MNVWHICIVNHLSKKVKRFYSLYGPSLGMICTKQGASIQAIHPHSFTSITSIFPPRKHPSVTQSITYARVHTHMQMSSHHKFINFKLLFKNRSIRKKKGFVVMSCMKVNA